MTQPYHPSGDRTRAVPTRSTDREAAATAPAAGPSRRRTIGITGVAAAGALALSACGSGNDPSAAATASAPSTPTDVGAAADVPVGSGIAVDKDGVKAVVAQPSKGTFTAYSSVCPHQGCVVGPADEEFVCPCHGSVFDMSSGRVTGGPAATGLSPYPVTVENGRVIVG